MKSRRPSSLPAVEAETPLTLTVPVAAMVPVCRLVELVNVFCLPAMVVAMSVPPRYSGPVSIMLDPIMAEPATSIEGALTGAENTALLLVSPSLSVPPESARRRV